MKLSIFSAGYVMAHLVRTFVFLKTFDEHAIVHNDKFLDWRGNKGNKPLQSCLFSPRNFRSRHPAQCHHLAFDAERVNVHWKQTNAQKLNTRSQPMASARLCPPLTPSPSPRGFPINAPCAVSKSIIRIHSPNPLSDSFADSRRRLPPATRTTIRRPH